MLTDWIYQENLRAFVLVLSQFVGYPFDGDDWLAIRYGIEGTDQEGGHWFDYEFAGCHILRLWLARDPGTAVVHVRVEAPTIVAPKVEAALQIFQLFHVKVDG